MKNVWLGTVALAAFAIAGPSQAADLNGKPAYKAPPVALASSWTGFYAGLGLGFRTSRTDATTTSGSVGTTVLDLATVISSEPFDGTGFRAAPYFGFNWQFIPQWVASIEGDFGFANQSTRLAGFRGSPAFLSTGSDADGLAVRTRWDSSLRGRLGYLVAPTTLAYATGGIAWQNYEVTSTCAGAAPCVTSGFSPLIISNSATKPGWNLGGGIETALGGHWLARAEYRYADFGSAPFNATRSSPLLARNPTVDNFDVTLRTHTATFGLAYKFGDPITSGDTGGTAAPFAMTPSPAMTSWSGPYTGFGLGAHASRADVATTSLLTGGIQQSLSGNRSATSEPLNGLAFRQSLFAGFNWQFARQWVAGVEGDIGYAGQKTTLGGLSFAPLSNSSDGVGSSLTERITWDAGLRARLGVLVRPATLIYAAGGAAWQHFEVTSTCASSACAANGYLPATIENSATKPGWTVGGGLETALSGNWLARGEYRYADFGTSPFTISRSSTTASLNPTIDNFDVKLRTHTVTFGLAYKFN